MRGKYTTTLNRLCSRFLQKEIEKPLMCNQQSIKYNIT